MVSTAQGQKWQIKYPNGIDSKCFAKAETYSYKFTKRHSTQPLPYSPSHVKVTPNEIILGKWRVDLHWTTTVAALCLELYRAA